MKADEITKMETDLVECIWKIKPDSCTDNGDGLIWTSDVIHTIQKYFHNLIVDMD